MTPTQDHFALRGDSGALVFNDDSPVGLVFGVKEALGRTYVCKASNVEKLLIVSFTPPASRNADPQLFDPATFPTDPKVPRPRFRSAAKTAGQNGFGDFCRNKSHPPYGRPTGMSEGRATQEQLPGRHPGQNDCRQRRHRMGYGHSTG